MWTLQRELSAWGATGPPLVGDGAMGTMLQAAGLALGEAPERWNVERPEAVTRIHAAYAAAGAAWVGTNTFGANRPRLLEAGRAEWVMEINFAAVECAREGAPQLPVLGSVGPTGCREARMRDAAYHEQIAELARSGVDGFLVETIVGLEEGLAAVRIAAAAGAGPVIASFTPGPDGSLLDGTPPERAAAALVRAGARVIGVNCGCGPESLLPVAGRLVAADVGPVLAAPNAGLPRVVAGCPVYELPPDAFARAAIQFRERGVRLIAGCCGTTPEHVRAVSDRLGHTPR